MNDNTETAIESAKAEAKANGKNGARKARGLGSLFKRGNTYWICYYRDRPALPRVLGIRQGDHRRQAPKASSRRSRVG